jgi:RHS repeat-associated protein
MADSKCRRWSLGSTPTHYNYRDYDAVNGKYAQICANRARHRWGSFWGRFLDRTRTSSLRGRRVVILPGQYYDDETGLHFNYFRDYDPVTGRYAESDPIGLDGGTNTYSYAFNNSVSNFDTYGLDVEVIVSYRNWYGHVDVRINNRVYGSGRYDVPGRNLRSGGLAGTNVMRVTDAGRHAESLEDCGCGATGYVLDVTPQQESLIQAYFDKQIANASPVPARPNSFILPDDYSFAMNNCATNAVDALQAGLPWYIDTLLSGASSPHLVEVRLLGVARPIVSSRSNYGVEK